MYRIRLVFIGVFFLYIFLYTAHGLYLGRTVYGDGIYYYSWLTSLVADRDIEFANNYAPFSGDQRTTPLGKEGNLYSVGPALLWMPPFIHLYNLFDGNGYDFVYQYLTGLTTVLYVLTGLVLLYITLSRYFPRNAAMFGIVLTAGATNLLFYGAVDTVNSHGLSFFAVCVLLSLLMYSPYPSSFAVGIMLGIISLIRTQDLVFGILLLPYLSRVRIFPIFLGFFAVLIPQSIAWKHLYGSYVISPYLYLADYGFNWSSPKIPEVLFSVNNGLFVWTPAALVGLAGLIRLVRQKKQLIHALFLIVFLIEVYVVGSWSTWWQGASYSGRMFVSSLSLLSFGFSALGVHINNQNILRFVMILFISFNMGAIVFYLLSA